MAGTLADLASSSLSNVRIIARVEHNVPAGTDQYVIDTARPDSAGHFELRGALGPDVPVTWNPDGSVPLEIEVYDELTGKSRYTLVNAVPPTTSTSTGWTYGNAPDISLPLIDGSQPAPGTLISQLLLPSTGSSTTQSQAATTAVDDADFPDGTYVDGAGDTYNEDLLDTSNLMVSAPRQSCPSDNYLSWRYMDAKYDKIRYVPLHHSWTRDRTRNLFDWSTTNSSQMEAGYKVDGDAYGGGLRYSVEQNASTGVHADATGQANRNNLLRMGWRYRKQQQICSYASGYGGVQFDTGARRYVPMWWTGDNRDEESSYTFSCNTNYKARIDNDIWVSRSSSVTFIGFFSLFGATLDSKQTRDSSHTVTYAIRNAYATAYVCGMGGDPTVAAQVKEVDP